MRSYWGFWVIVLSCADTKDVLREVIEGGVTGESH